MNNNNNNLNILKNQMTDQLVIYNQKYLSASLTHTDNVLKNYFINICEMIKMFLFSINYVYIEFLIEMRPKKRQKCNIQYLIA